MFWPVGKFYLFFESPGDGDVEVPVTFGNVALAIFGYLVQVAEALQIVLVPCLLLTASMTIFVAIHQFIENVQNGGVEDPKKDADNVLVGRRPTTIARLHEKFNELVILVTAVNEAWSLLIFWFLLQAAAWYSTNLDIALKMGSYFARTYLFYHMAHTAVSVVLSAECSRKVTSSQENTERKAIGLSQSFL